MSTRLVIAIDPGKMTGYWVYDVNRLQTGSGGQLPQWEFIDLLARILETWQGEEVALVCETFTITQRSLTQRGDRLWSVEQIGIIQYLQRRNAALTSYTEQSPADAKSFANNEKLRRVGWYQVGQEHARDAARHALLYATRNGHIDPRVLLNGWGE